ncbi:Clavaminate synthase-like protein [Aaosphaeria arxii CBS 175.79]|uniref:Clavaminate synthase-like protein n=1 Tax=Aaosphaeria arxii CBS 175.79 TaxID=1450172 RepID=A0A6A5XPK8_9PLEO|nr:Clavaminate synthase-like protein [Aaosphaeria arxii CBS 175.79]KAF2014839.1 Clavaminate synthase-like protein [Aaosphaeria arxii CBS 175.79]
MRYVSRNRPFVVRKGASSFPAFQKWNADYLSSTMKDLPVKVARTPCGNADSVLPIGNEGHVFIKPHEIEQPFRHVLEKIQEQELCPGRFAGPTCYAQTQNDNLRNEYASLFDDVPKSIPFARVALEKEPDAINFWLGNSHSTTALHKDNYENIYVQIIGQKHFVLLPPVESPCVNEKSLLAATYKPRDIELSEEDLIVQIDEPKEYVPFATWDPDAREQNGTTYSPYSRPLRVTLSEGDMLYLPALWYHKVSQTCSSEGICCAVNYWYDLDFSGSFWAMSNFVRGAGLVSLQQN